MFGFWPYTNFHQLNLDWIIKTVKELDGDVDAIKEEIENMIVPGNGYILPSTNDDTDRTIEITNCLTNYGYCFLGPGRFVINSTIPMPDKTTLMGMGSGTELILADDSTEAIAINVGSYCSVANMTINGYSTNLPYESYNRGLRKGIALLGDYSSFNDGTYAHNYARLDNLIIKNFNHSGIWCYKNDGAGSFLANNIDIQNCHTGINIEFFSEFHSFTNVRCRWCNIALVMQGGNNLFANCHFDNNLLGIKIDNQDDSLVNADHSSFTNCSICHSDNNNGYAIWADFSLNGMCFSNCQIWYGKIYLNRCIGYKFDNNIIAHAETVVSNSNTCSFTNNLFKDASPVITLTNCLNTIWENNQDGQGYLINNDIDRGSDRNLNASTIRVANMPNLSFQGLGFCATSGKWTVVITLPGVFSMSSIYYTINRIVLVGKGIVPDADLASVTQHFEPTYIRVENIPYAGNPGDLCLIDIRGDLLMNP